MTIAYVEPLAVAYRRMNAALFRPFDLGKWFAIGFASWIASWSGGGSFNYQYPAGSDGDKSATFKEALATAFPQLGALWDDPWWRIGLIAVGLLIVVLGILILWISSRGEFVFLDAVLNRRSAIVEPWRATRVQGNSLFLWRLAFGLITLFAFALLSGTVFVLSAGGRIPHSLADVAWVPFLLTLGLVWLPLLVTALYVDLFLRHFVTPIMFRDRCTTTAAWRTFLPLLRERLGAFLVYGLFVLVAHIGVFLALIPAVLLTCCLLGCLLVLPYIGAVLWLPVSYTFRAYGPEFLAQFGPSHDVWPRPAAERENPPDAASPAL